MSVAFYKGVVAPGNLITTMTLNSDTDLDKKWSMTTGSVGSYVTGTQIVGTITYFGLTVGRTVALGANGFDRL